MADFFDFACAPYTQWPDTEEGIYAEPCIWDYENFMRTLDDEPFDLASIGDAA